MGTVGNVSAGKPRAAGAIFIADADSTLPTTADEALDSAFVEVGYASDAGVVNANSRTSETIKAWGGDVVLETQTEKTDRFTITFIEMMKPEVLKIVHGDSNVSGTITNGITVNVNSSELESHAWVIDMILRGGALKRIVIPYGKVTEVADVNYKDNEAVAYQVTISASPDAAGNTHYEYIKAA